MMKMSGATNADEWMTTTGTGTIADDDPHPVPGRPIQTNVIPALTEDHLAAAPLDDEWIADPLPGTPNTPAAHLLATIVSALPRDSSRATTVLLRPDVKNGVTVEDHAPQYRLALERGTMTARGKPNSPPCPVTRIPWKRTELSV